MGNLMLKRHTMQILLRSFTQLQLGLQNPDKFKVAPEKPSDKTTWRMYTVEVLS